MHKVILEQSRMVRRAAPFLPPAVVPCATLGYNSAKGLKQDITFIGDKTAEILDKPETLD